MSKVANGNVVALGDHLRARARLSPQESADVLTDCRELALDHIAKSLAGMLAVALILLGLFTTPASASGAELPRVFLDTTYSPPSGNTITVNAGGNLQTAINNAQPGDTIVLQAGTTFTGTFTLPNKGASAQWIYIRSSAYDSLPAPGNRVSPANVANMPTIAGAGSPVIALQTDANAHHFRFVGIEIKPSAGQFSSGLIRLGNGETSLSTLPNNIVFDRCYIHGDPTVGGRRGIALNSAASAVIDSYLSDWKDGGADSQAVAGWNTPGPVKLVNNHLEGAGENVMFGGADPSVPNLVPSDIEIRGNYFFKPVAWRSQTWVIKNLFELKNSRRTLVEGNIFENDWAQAQAYAINIKSSNQDGTAPWSVTEDFTFRHNIVRHGPSAIKFCGLSCDGAPTAQGRGYLVQDNLFVDIDSSAWGGDGNFLQTTQPMLDLVVNHNTVIHNGNTFAGGDGGERANTGFQFTNNIVQAGTYGFKGSGTPQGTATLNTFFPGHVFAKNIIAGASAPYYPPNNFFPADFGDVEFVNLSGGDYHLAASSPYKNAGTDGKDLGANIDSLEAATANVISGHDAAVDATAPTAAITSPEAGSSVSGVIQLVATAWDDIGVAGVRFLLDGSTLGAEILTSPYVLPWNTAGVANGPHTITAIARDVAGNRTTSAPVPLLVASLLVASRSPYGGAAFSVPGRLEAENFDRGGEGISFHDLTPGNQGGAYRPDEDVDIITPRLGGYVVNNFQTGEWLEYTINVSRDGDFLIEERVSSEYTSSRFHVEIDGRDRTGSISVPSTGSWQTFQWVGASTVSLTAGQHVVRIVAEQEYFNIDAIRFRRP